MDVNVPITSTAVAGARVRDVRCEHCGVDFRYRLIRRAEGKWIGDGDVSESTAEQRANATLARLLEHDQDPVRCPKCGNLQAEMVRQQKHVRASPLHYIQCAACMMIIVGVLLLLARAADATNMFNRPFTLGDPHPLKSWGWTWVGLGVVTFAAYGFLRTRRNRFLDDPTGRRPPFGVPTPWRLNEPPPLPRGILAPPDAAGWTSVQLLDVRWPAVCCVCLEPTTDRKQLGPPFYDLAAAVPFCRTCRRHVVIASTRKAIVVGVIGGFAIALFSWGGDELSLNRIGGSFLAGFIPAAIWGWIWGDQIDKPIRFRRFHALRNTALIRCENPAYGERLLDENA